MIDYVNHIIFCTLVGPAFNNLAAGCGRTPARMIEPPSSTSINLRTTFLRTVTPAASHRKKCSEEEEKITACLNGKCYAVDLSGRGNWTASCHCPEYYEGKRCEKLTNFFVLYAQEVKKAGITAGVVVLVIILSFIISYLTIKKREKRKQEQQLCEREKFGDILPIDSTAQPLMTGPIQATDDHERAIFNGVSKGPETGV